ncbi:CC0125/CC1285 family lipoprotein [Caulobacter sp. NIBR2454]|uniref:CC0125/CC1285 family lipoprotein n=1 Tax=Caulobacter sp. NIBR2454 TaxID=3015996 RepID=UPI0022B5F2DF|nr:hypothetical protein [Caulobacter sp. NIBR2454]
MKARSLAIAGLLAVAATVSACATATPYQPNVPGQTASGGFSEMRIEADRFRVNFAGNSLTSRDTVERYLLYRAAELTVAEGYDWFELADRKTDKTSRTYIDRDPFYNRWSYSYWAPSWSYFGPRMGWRSWDPYWGDPFWADRMDVRTVNKFEASAEIVLRKGPKPADRNAFDAREVIANLGPSIQRPPMS